MNEQRPPTSPGMHPAGQPQRVIPAQPVSHAPGVPHAPHAPRLNAAHAPHPPMQQGPRPVARPAPAASLPVDDDLVVLEEDGIALDDDGQTTAPAPHAAGAAPLAKAPAAADAPKKITFNADAVGRQRQWKRLTTSTGHGACRVKTFHGKCSDQGLEYLDDAINHFLDAHPEIEVKHVQSNVAMFDGKFKDFALIVNLWY